jgi:hypothetical protein
MIIILVNLSENMDEPQIEELIRSLGKDCEIGKISILAQKNSKTSLFEFHGLVAITPDSIVKEIIEELMAKKINGGYSTVHEYKARYDHHDPINNKYFRKESGDEGLNERRNLYSEIYF